MSRERFESLIARLNRASDLANRAFTAYEFDETEAMHSDLHEARLACSYANQTIADILGDLV